MSLLVDDSPYDEVSVEYKGKEIKVKYKLFTPKDIITLSQIQGNNRISQEEKYKQMIMFYIKDIILEPKVEEKDYEKINAAVFALVVDAISQKEHLDERIQSAKKLQMT